MPNDYTDPLEIIVRQQVSAGKTGSKRKVSYVDILQGIAKSIATPFRFPSNERMKKFAKDNKAATQYWYERNQPDYYPPGHPFSDK